MRDLKTTNPQVELRITSKAQNEILAKLIDVCGNQEAAAKELGVSKATVAAWLNFKHVPNANWLHKRPAFYRKVIPRLEQLTGRKFADIFPNLPKDVLKCLATKRVVVREVPVEQLRMAVHREQLTYEVDQIALLEHGDRREALKKVLTTLSYREREIIKLRYGLDDGITYTLEEVGHIFKVTKDRIRQIEAKAIRKLQEPNRRQPLVEFFGEPPANLP